MSTESPAAFSADDLARASIAAPPEIIRLVEERLGSRATIAASFGVEDVVVIDLCRTFAPSIGVFTLDTGRLHVETYEVMEQVRRRYAIAIEVFAPERAAVEALESAHGFFSFRASVDARRACCELRKVEPLGRALRGRGGWLTGLRRDQTASRAEVAAIAWDADHGLWKINPLAAWTSAQTWAYARAHELPTSPLHDQGFASIGCAPCTRAVRAGEHERSGRWWWEHGEPDAAKECGLHVTGGRLVRGSAS